jgi:branched-chain amino acid aminotransferase
MSIYHCYLNGEFIPEEEGRISCLDRGFLYGDGLFETLPAYGGKPFLLDRHYRRLSASCNFLKLSCPEADELEGIIRKLLEMNGLNYAYLRITLTRGKYLGKLGLPEGGEATLVVVAREYAGYPPEFYTQGIDLALSSLCRNAASPLSRLKTLNYLESMLAREEAASKGATEVLLQDSNSHIAEAATANVFWVRGKRLFTPSGNCAVLPGIVRGWVLDKCKESKFPAEVGEYPLSTLEEAEEIFLTNSLMGIMPVRSWEGRAVGGQCPGEITSWLMDEYQREIERFTVGE